jgi:hypothetical protein
MGLLFVSQLRSILELVPGSTLRLNVRGVILGGVNVLELERLVCPPRFSGSDVLECFADC